MNIKKTVLGMLRGIQKEDAAEKKWDRERHGRLGEHAESWYRTRAALLRQIIYDVKALPEESSQR